MPDVRDAKLKIGPWKLNPNTDPPRVCCGCSGISGMLRAVYVPAGTLPVCVM